jgi:pimeloyl-ACP methyl ester carboxylesterase
MNVKPALALLLFTAPILMTAQTPAAWTDPSPHKVSFIAVEPEVKLEVLDWGGSGSPMVLLAGGGNSAHVWDDFALKLKSDHHVYAITRRGFGASGFAKYDDIDRLGEDVFAVIESLKLAKPVLVGHSLGGAELSSIANHHADRVSALVYLDAGYQYAFDNGKGMQMSGIQGGAPRPPQATQADRANFAAFRKWYQQINGLTLPEGEVRSIFEPAPEGGVLKQRIASAGAIPNLTKTKYTAIPVRSLLIFAAPHDQGAWLKANTDPKVKEAADAYAAKEAAIIERQMKAIADAVPTAKLVKLPGAHHYVYMSNEADVLREMRAFLKN